MKAFRFRGERLLEWRRVQADAARMEFVRASASARESGALVQEAERECERSAQELLALVKTPIDVATLERYRNWIDRQQIHAQACRQSHRERCDVADAASRVLQLANRHVKVMERLRERAVARHADDVRKTEMKELDQLATLQFVRRRMEGAADRDH